MSIDISIPTSAVKKRYSAIVSRRLSLSGLFVRIETNENIHEAVNRIATIDVNSSIKWVSNGLAMCREVMIKRQKPSRFADVFRIWGEVLLAILVCVCYETTQGPMYYPFENSWRRIMIQLTTSPLPMLVFPSISPPIVG